MAGNQNTGSTNPFDFEDETGRSDAVRRSSTPSLSEGSDPDPTAADPFDFDQPVRTRTATRTGQPISVTALVLAVVGGVLIAIGIARGLGSIQLEAERPYASVLWWGTLTLIGVLIALIAVVLGFVAVIKAQPRVIAVIAFVLALVAGIVGAYIGFRIGADQLALEVAQATGAEGPEAVERVEEYLRERGIDPAPLRPILDRIFG
jgi:hypothetical protein